MGVGLLDKGIPGTDNGLWRGIELPVLLLLLLGCFLEKIKPFFRVIVSSPLQYFSFHRGSHNRCSRRWTLWFVVEASFLKCYIWHWEPSIVHNTLYTHKTTPVITKGYEVRATTTKGQNDHALTLWFAYVSGDRWSKQARSDYEW